MALAAVPSEHHHHPGHCRAVERSGAPAGALPRPDRGGTVSAASPHLRTDIQVLRGAAVLLVVLFHLGVLPGGFIGVDAFFAISGFVVTRSAIREVRRSGGFDVIAFYGRRVKRILPALALMTSTVGVLSVAALAISLQPIAARTAIGAHALIANVVLYREGGGYFDPADERNPFLHTWSLSIEEQFYLVFPLAVAGVLLAVIANRRRGRTIRVRTVALIAGSLVAAASVAMSVLMTGEMLDIPGVGLPERFAFYSPFTRAWQFLAGALLAVLELRPSSDQSRRLVPPVALGLLAICAVIVDEAVLWPGPTALIPVALVIIAIAAGDPGDRRPAGSPDARGPLARGLSELGADSYGWYLWHWPLIVLTRDLFGHGTTLAWPAAILGLVVARLSRTRVEDPIRFGRRTDVRRVLVWSTVAPISVASILLIGGERQWGIDRFNTGTSPSIASELGCIDAADASIVASDCRVAGGDAGLLMLLGDSHAASLSDGVVEVAGSLGFDVVIWARSSCPFLPGTPLLRGADDPRVDEGCLRWQRQAADIIDRLEPDVVILGHRSSGYTDLGDRGEREMAVAIGDSSARWPIDGDEAVRLWADALDRTVSELSERGIASIIVHNVPEFRSLDDFGFSLVRRPDPPSLPRQAALAESAAVTQAEARVVARNPQVAGVSPSDILCDGSRCYAGLRPVWYYADRNHLSPEGSRLLVTVLTDALEGIR